MSKIKIEFYHDAVCGWCYILSPRLRKLVKNNKNIEIQQRCFVLQRNDEEMVKRFGSLESAKFEILNHWKSCKGQADDPASIDIEGMRSTSFSYPSGYLAALGAKTAELMGDSNTHWDYFDEIQRQHLKLNTNIGDREVIIQTAQLIGLDPVVFSNMLFSDEVKQAVEKDMRQANKLNLRTIPTIVINGNEVISQALSNLQLEELFL
jgi:putative protein-disulfide isomerase